MDRYAKPLLVISNGHAEDRIAAAVVERLGRCSPDRQFVVLPLVGTGHYYDDLAQVTVLGPRRTSPGGGFSGIRPGYILRDLRAGWMQMLRAQLSCLRSLRGRVRGTVCVGDVVLVAVAAYYVRRPVVFLSTAKSHHAGWRKDHYWCEKWLMRRTCRLVLPRDEATTRDLQRAGIPAEWQGNPMLDCVRSSDRPLGEGNWRYVVGMIPGSREEAYDNFITMLDAVPLIAGSAQALGAIGFVVALAGSIRPDRLMDAVRRRAGWTVSPGDDDSETVGVLSHQDGGRVHLVRNRFGDMLRRSQVVIGTAGMANEQAVGQGLPLVTFPGPGPQVTARFLRIQQDVLGGAELIVNPRPGAIAEAVLRMLRYPEQWEARRTQGRRRMGRPGAADRIARRIVALMQNEAA